MTSIIFTCYLQSMIVTNMTCAAISNIRKYTDPKDYELIIIDDVPQHEIENKGYWRNLDFASMTHIVNDENFGYCANMNQGAKIAKGEYLCFIENDIFVPENWLPELKYYIDNDLADVICPQQHPKTYAEMQRIKTLPYDHDEVLWRGVDEQGMMMIRKDLFEKTGGWDERFKKIYGWKAFYPRLNKVGARIHNTAKVQITHVTGASYYQDIANDLTNFRVQQAIEGKIIHDEFG